MKKLIALAAALPLLLLACSSGPAITVFNWGEYMDEDLNDAFTKETGIKVRYRTFTSNEALYASLKSGGVAYDVIVPSDYMVSLLIEEDMLLPLDFSLLGNYGSIMEQFKGLEYDPGDKYSVPYLTGSMGIIYNTSMVTKPVDSWDILWDADYKGQIIIFDSARDTIGIALMRLGYSVNTTSEAELRQATASLIEQKPLLQARMLDEIFDKLINNAAAIGTYYAGDFVEMNKENPLLAFAWPKEGTNVFVDAFCIPKGAKNPEAAHKYIDFMCRADNGLANVEAVGYSTPLQSVYEILDEHWLTDGISYPEGGVLQYGEVFKSLPKATRELYDILWLEYIG
jgi:spermidine/putrescine transport system substrate-binding protein